MVFNEFFGYLYSDYKLSYS